MQYRWLTILFVCLFAGVALFGVLTMLHMEHAGAACLPAPMGLVACPETVGHALAHLSAFQRLGMSTSPTGVAGIFLAALLLVLGGFFLSRKESPSLSVVLMREQRRDENVLASPSREPFLRWIARLQQSPSFS